MLSYNMLKLSSLFLFSSSYQPHASFSDNRHTGHCKSIECLNREVRTFLDCFDYNCHFLSLKKLVVLAVLSVHAYPQRQSRTVLTFYHAVLLVETWKGTIAHPLQHSEVALVLTGKILYNIHFTLLDLLQLIKGM